VAHVVKEGLFNLSFDEISDVIALEEDMHNLTLISRVEG